MSAIQRNILTVLKPTIKLDELKIPDIESGTDNAKDGSIKEPLSKFSNLIPLIRINEYDVQGDRLESFILDCTGFYPVCRFVFSDRDGLFTARHYPTDGDIIQLYIRSAGEETTFKPIRIDFTVINITPMGGGYATPGPSKLMIDGRMKVPNLFTEKVEYEDNTSWNALLNIAERLGLGFASNVEDTADKQIWTNPYDTSEKFIKDIVANSYLDDDSFFTSYIDPYYNLTVVEVNRLFDQDPELEASLQFQINAGDNMGAEGSGTSETEMPNFITNNFQFQGTARYVSLYQQINNSGEISKNNGYKRYTQYWDLEAKEFVSEFIDPLTTNTPGMIPATRGRVLADGEVEGPVKEQVKYKYLGTQGDNVHPNFSYSAILNFQNLAEMNKFGMTVELDTFNPAIWKYSRIYCMFLEYGDSTKRVLTAPSNEETPPGTQRRETEDGNDPLSPNGVLNEYLSGFYVVTGIDYFLTQPGALKQRLHLRRREVVPTT